MENKFNFLNLESNDNLSNMNKKEFNEFSKKLLEYKLKLRGNLGLDSGLTFGLELEFENIHSDSFEDDFNKLNTTKGLIDDGFHDTNIWNLTTDKTLTKTNGKEVRSPILTDDINYWKDLTSVCSFIKKNASVGKNCAGHIHVGSQALGYDKDALLNLLKIWATYENVLYRYGYNEYLTKNPGILYSKPSKSVYNEVYNKAIKDNYSIRDILCLLYARVNAINFSIMTLVSDYNRIAYKDTIEFRSPNGTLDPIIWQNNVNTFIKLILACKKDVDMDIVNKRAKSTLKLDTTSDYDNIYLNEAIELSDLIFDNNLDKLYFLRQYIKNNEVSHEGMKRTKKFTI